MKYDFVEIGTSDFRTLAQSTKLKGISIEPVSTYLNNIPEREGLTKLNIAISNRDGELTVYYCKPDAIKTMGLPSWLRGCNSVNIYHPTVERLCREKNIDMKLLVTEERVQVKTLGWLFAEYNISEIHKLHIDTEGHDYVILKSFFSLVNAPVVREIKFESNELMPPEHYSELLFLARAHGYKARRFSFDTILTLKK